jgi:hypothetical protein
MTNGKTYSQWSEAFLNSFKKYNLNHPILIETRDLSRQQIGALKKNYENLYILEEKINWEKVSKRSGHSIQRLKRMQTDCETKNQNVSVTGCVVWKQYISVEDRYRRTLKKGIEFCMDKNIKYMLHFDMDMGFFGSVEPIIDIVKENDVTLQFRSKLEFREDKTKIAGYFVGFKCNDNSLRFMNKWIDYIDEIPLKKKPKGYGQLSLYLAYESMKDEMDIGIVPNTWTATMDRIIELNGEHKAILFNAAKGPKGKNLQFFRRIK